MSGIYLLSYATYTKAQYSQVLNIQPISSHLAKCL